MPDLTDLPPWSTSLLEIVVIAIVAAVAYLVIRLSVDVGVRHVVERRTVASEPTSADAERRVRTLGRLAMRIAATVIVVIAVLMILGEFDVDIGPALAGLGVVGIAVGFGAQSLVRDWFAGVFIVIENQFSHGDVVRVAGVEGVVEDFSLRRTTLRDVDGTLHTVPNGQIVVTSNLTRLWPSLRASVGLSDRGDLRRATDAVDAAGREMKADPEWRDRILAAPRVARVTTDGTLEIEAQGKPDDHGRIRDELRRRARAALKAAGIAMPPGGRPARTP